MFHIPALH